MKYNKQIMALAGTRWHSLALVGTQARVRLRHFCTRGCVHIWKLCIQGQLSIGKHSRISYLHRL